MRANILALLVFCISFTTSSAQCASKVGPYYWGGQIKGVSPDSIVSTARKLTDSLNAEVIRITLACNNDIVYKASSSCITGSNLTSLASRADFNAIITDPQFKTVIITAYDWVSFNDCSTANFVDTAFYTPANSAAMRQEYTDLANYLKQFTDKTFIITNWEGDNSIYCGSAFYYPNCAEAPKNLLGFKKWMDNRSAGIRSANAANVKIGIEFCNIHSLENLSKPSVLNDVIPTADADYYLYSSYESINVSTAQMSADIDFIRDKLNSFSKDTNALIIGEFGFDKTSWGGTANAGLKLDSIIQLAKEKAIPYSIAWVLIDSPYNFGLYDSDGNITDAGLAMKNYICTPCDTINIDAIYFGNNPTTVGGSNGSITLVAIMVNGKNATVPAFLGGGNQWAMPATYNWEPDGETTSTIVNKSAGTYVVTTTIAQGCSVTDTIVLEDPSIGVLELYNQTLQLQAHPNPFSRTTQFTYTLKYDMDVRLTIYDLLGREVRTIVNEKQTAGKKNVTWKEIQNENIPPGIYLCTLNADGKMQSLKVVID